MAPCSDKQADQCPNLWTQIRSPKRSFLVIENKLFGLVSAKTRSIISGTRDVREGMEPGLETKHLEFTVPSPVALLK